MSVGEVRVLFLGKLRDLADRDEVKLPAPLDWSGLLAGVSPTVAAELASDRTHVACGGIVLTEKGALMAGEGDEVALLPPVSGG
jgi:molybdopterin synthase sulfur carrier subunit